MPETDENPPTKLPEDDLAASIVEAWAELDRQAEAKNPHEFRAAREMLAEWGGKLEALLRGKKA